MNYSKIYESLIERARYRIIDGYFEIHHIVPRCIGGTDLETNLVKLTPEEHYLAHQLLCKIYRDNIKLVYAAAMMVPNRPSNKLYGWLRRKFSEAKSKEQTGIGNSQFGTTVIRHELVGKKRVRISNINEYIAQGWIIGKTKQAKQAKVKTDEELKNIESNVLKFREYYKLYSQVGFEKFVEMTGYEFSKPNLVQRFAKLLPEFVPQNGKKRNNSPVL